MADRLLTWQQAADMLSLSVNTIQRMAAKGDLPLCRVSARSTRIRESDVQALIDRGMDRPPHPRPGRRVGAA